MSIVKDNIQPKTNKIFKELNDTNLGSYLQQGTIINIENARDELYKLLKQKKKSRFELAQIDSCHQLLTFHYVVSVDHFKAIGSGTTKKDAMHSAAYKLLLEIAGISMNDNSSPNGDFRLPDMSIGDLYSLCGKKGIMPIYEEISDPNCHEFTITCSVRKFKTIGNGKNKKVAKRLAAKNMLLLLKNGESLDGN